MKGEPTTTITKDDTVGSQLTFEDYLHEQTAEQGGSVGVSTHQNMIEENDAETGKYYDLIECVLDPVNIAISIEKVKENKGAPGIDGMEVNELEQYFRVNLDMISDLIRNRRYKPQLVKRAWIPKEKQGEFRKLGIPTAQDRVIQEAMANVLVEIYDPMFSDNSFGFRPGRNCQKAIKRALRFANEGYIYVVDLDLEKFFDKVCQSKLIRIMTEQIDDPDFISLTSKFLNAGVLEDGLFQPTPEGVPQGGPLSPVLANIMLDQLDKELEKRGHKFIRYADDLIIFCKSPRAAQRVLESITNFIEIKLKLKVNREKTEVCRIDEIKYLGYGFYFNMTGECRPCVHPISRKKLKDKIRKLTSRNGARSYVDIQYQLEKLIKGWINHFIIADMTQFMKDMDSWMRRRIRALCWHRWKKVRTKYAQLRKRGMPHQLAFNLANTRRGAWAVSNFQYIKSYINNSVIHDTWKLTSFVRTFEYKRRNYRNKILKAKGLITA